MQKQISELQMIHLVPRYIKLKIPKDWEVVRLKKIVKSHNSGIFKNQEFYGEGENIVGVSDLYNHSKIDGQIFRLVMLTEEEKKDHVLEKGDLIYGESSLVRTGIGKSLYVTEKGEGTIFAWHTRRFKIDSKASPSFVYYMLDFEKIRNSIINRSTTTALTGVTTTDYFNTKILLPKKEEQQKIASILSIVDSLINQTQKEIEQTHKLKKGLMQKLLTKGIGHTKFKKTKSLFGNYEEIPEIWELEEARNIFKITMGQSPPSESYNQVGQGLPFYQGVTDFGTIHPKPTVWCSDPKKTAKEQEILFSVRAPVGETNITETQCCLGRGVASLDPQKNDLFYVYYLVTHNKKRFSVYSQGTTYDAINRDEIAKTKLPFTKNKSEQQKISSILSNVSSQIQKQQEYKSNLETLKKGLMQKLLTGQIRVRV